MNNPSPRERRTGTDRRQRPTSPFSRYWFFGSRRGPRRTDDPVRNYYVDRYSYRSLLAIVAILTLCAVDGILTLKLVARGAREINPLMNFILGFGKTYFLLIKYGITGLGLLMLLIHKNFYILSGRLNIRYVIVFLIVMYLALISYEVILLW